MEVTRVVKQSVILIIFYLSNVMGYGLLNPGSIAYRSNSGSQPLAISAHPQGQVMFQNLPVVYSHSTRTPAYQGLSLPSFTTSSIEYTYKNAVEEVNPSLIKLVLQLVKNLVNVLFSVINLTDVDRYVLLRSAVDNINAILDYVFNIKDRIFQIASDLFESIQSVPILEIAARLTLTITYVISYVPLQLFTIIKNVLKSLIQAVADTTPMPTDHITYAL